MRPILKRFFFFANSLVASIIANYKNRVAAASGIYEGETCLNSKLNVLYSKSLLASATFVQIPSGYKSGTIYSELPNNGNGDLTFTRASAATRVNASGNIETLSSGVAAIDYSLGGCPNLLLEPQRKNNLINSNWAGAVAGSPGTAPTNFILLFTGGSLSLPTSIYGTDSQAITFTTSAARQVMNQSYTTLANVIVVLSIYVESYSGSITPAQIFGEATGLTGTSKTYYYQDGTNLGSGLSNISSIGRYYMVYSNTVGGAVSFRYGLGVSGNATGSVTFSRPQLEDNGAGGSVNYPTSFIPTTTSGAATRVVANFTRSNIYTNGLIGASGFTWLFEIKNNLSIKGDQTDTTKFYGMYIGNSATAPTSAINIYNDNTTALLKIGTISGTTTTSRYTTTAASIKVAITFDGSTLNVWVNGTKQISALSFSATLSTFEHMCALNTDVTKFISQMALWNTPLSDAQCIALTS